MNRIFVAVLSVLWIHRGQLCDVNHKGLLYAHMPNNGDQLGPYEDDESLQTNLIVTQAFYQRNERTLWINENGVLSYFTEFDRNMPIPFEDLNAFFGPRLVAPFWADHGITADNPKANIWYRETRDDSRLLGRATKDVTRAFDNATDFKAERLFIATWSRVKSFYGASEDLGNLRRKRDVNTNKKDRPVLARSLCVECRGENSYQVVIINGGEDKDCYIMFNYHTIEWTTGYPGEDTKIGFNSGFGQSFNMDLGDMVSLTQLPCYTNVGKAGRFMFKVNGDDIVPAGPTVAVA